MQQCLDQIDEMINHYPESKYTGYLMLRMAQIYQAKNQVDKTSEIYRILIDNFPQEKQLLAQAKELLKKVEK
jgi:outer membrane protein assembly factor BamD (BamD/ComL family)